MIKKAKIEKHNESNKHNTNNKTRYKWMGAIVQKEGEEKRSATTHKSTDGTSRMKYATLFI